MNSCFHILSSALLFGFYLCQEASDHCKDPSHTYDVSGSDNGVIDLTSVQNYRCVNLSHKRIPSLDNGTFSHQWDIRTLDLSYNLISELPSLILNPLPRLEYLSVTNNKLTSLPATLFKKTLWLRIIDFSNNNLTDVPLSVFNYSFFHLELVNLTHNALTSFEPWNYVYPGVKSRGLDLRWNNISDFTNSYNLSIRDASKLSVYDMVTNDLRYNSLRQWKNSYLLHYFTQSISIEKAVLCMLVDLRDNPWLCDCHMFPLVKTISYSIVKYSDHRFASIRCHGPAELRGKRIFFDLQFGDLVCNVSQNCPKKCLCQERPNDRILSIDCQGGNLTEVPNAFPDSPYRKTELYLDDNQISRLDVIDISKQIVKLSMKNNGLIFINGSVIKDIASHVDAKVDFSENLLTSLPEEMSGLKHQHATVTGNRVECSCTVLWMVDWLNKPPKPKYSDKPLQCSFKGDIYTIADLDEDILECRKTGSLLLIVILTGILAVVIVLLVTAKRCPYETKVLAYKIFRIHPADKYIVDKCSDTLHDMYVSFDEEDPYLRQWVKRVLMRRLEMSKPFYRLCLSCKHLPTGPEAEGRLDLMEQSKRMLIILSGGYETNKWCIYESSQSECLEHIAGRIIYLLYDKHASKIASEEPWKSRIHGRKCFTLGERMMWSKLKYELPVKPVRKR